MVLCYTGIQATIIQVLHCCHYPSWPKSSVNFLSFSKSSSFTVGFVFSREFNMSFCEWRMIWALNFTLPKIISFSLVYQLSLTAPLHIDVRKLELITYHSNNRFQKLIPGHIHPGHLYGIGVTWRAWGQQAIHYIIWIVPLLSSNLPSWMWCVNYTFNIQ